MLAWAMDAQADDPNPSTTVDRAGLDVLQADAAAAVAGATGSWWWSARPAPARPPCWPGRGRSPRPGRPVFGVAPTAKAARVLGARTGMAADTVAKLLHEWARTDRPPDAPIPAAQAGRR